MAKGITLWPRKSKWPRPVSSTNHTCTNPFNLPTQATTLCWWNENGQRYLTWRLWKVSEYERSLLFKRLNTPQVGHLCHLFCGEGDIISFSIHPPLLKRAKAHGLEGTRLQQPLVNRQKWGLFSVGLWHNRQGNASTNTLVRGHSSLAAGKVSAMWAHSDTHNLTLWLHQTSLELLNRSVF